jgi:hypothetical protein
LRLLPDGHACPNERLRSATRDRDPARTALWRLTSEQTGAAGNSAMIGYLFGA